MNGESGMTEPKNGSRRTLAATDCAWAVGERHAMRLEVRGHAATVFADGKKLFAARFQGLATGGIAILAEVGTGQFHDVAVEPVE